MSRTACSSPRRPPVLLDQAMSRRFDAVIKYPLPSSDVARALIKNRLASVRLSRIAWTKVDSVAEGLSHAEITLAEARGEGQRSCTSATAVTTSDLIERFGSARSAHRRERCMAERNLPHIFIEGRAASEQYQRPPRKITPRPQPVPEDREGHGQRLRGELESAEADGKARREQQDMVVFGVTEGVYVTFESFPGLDLALESLDPSAGKVHPHLVSVRQVACSRTSWSRRPSSFPTASSATS